MSERLVNYPILLLAISVAALYVSEWIGVSYRRRAKLERDDRDDFTLIVSSTLTLLGLIIGFTFSMAVSRYDQRKNYEEDEANAIGTEYVRTDFLPPASDANVRSLRVRYLAQRILFYTAHETRKLPQINELTAR